MNLKNWFLVFIFTVCVFSFLFEYDRYRSQKKYIQRSLCESVITALDRITRVSKIELAEIASKEIFFQNLDKSIDKQTVQHKFQFAKGKAKAYSYSPDKLRISAHVEFKIFARFGFNYSVSELSDCILPRRLNPYNR